MKTRFLRVPILLLIWGLLLPQPRVFSVQEYIFQLINSNHEEKRQLGLVIKHLRSTPIGYQLTEQAGVTLRAITWGTVSHVDQMIRLGFHENANSTFPFELEIRLRKEQSVNTAALDLAHELVHGLYSRWKEKLALASVDDFILSQIEGPGGEVDARFVECKVWGQLQELFYDVDRRCSEEEIGRNGYENIKSGFFFLGKFAGGFRNWLVLQEETGSRILQKRIQEKPILFESATRGLPYPISLTIDYFEMRAEVCRLRPEQCPG